MRQKKLSLVGLIGITVAFFASVRPVPQTAESGWLVITYMVIAAIFFALPIALMSAELSTTYTEKGGSQVWIKRALGERWSFVSTLLMMFMMIVALVMILSTVTALMGDVIGNDELGKNNVLTFFVIIGMFWLITFLCLKVDMLHITSLGAVIGVYIPFALLAVLSVAYIAKVGIVPGSLLSQFSPGALVPDLAHPTTLATISAVIFIFAGVEMSAVHINDVKNPTKNYPVGVIIAVLGVTAISIIAGLGTADANTPTGIQLDNVCATFCIMLAELGLPVWIANVMAACVIIGVITQVASWILGPCQSLLQASKSGMLPKFFHKTNKNGDPVNIILLQAVLASFVALPMLIMKNVDEVFNVLTTTATLFYCIIYILISISAIYLRYKDKEALRPFRLGARGNGLMWGCAACVFIISLGTVLIGFFIPPSNVKPDEVTMYVLLQVVFTVAVIALALIVYALRKPQWKDAPAPQPQVEAQQANEALSE